MLNLKSNSNTGGRGGGSGLEWGDFIASSDGIFSSAGPVNFLVGARGNAAMFYTSTTEFLTSNAGQLLTTNRGRTQ